MDINKLVSSLSNSGVLGGLAGGAVSGALMSNKKMRKGAGTLLKVGGVAALGGLAWKAYQNYQGSAGSAPGGAPARTGDPGWQGLTRERFALASEGGPDSAAMLLVQAMVAAANADGHLDAGERQRILERAASLQLAAEEKAALFDVLNDPPTMAWISERVDCPELAAEVYLSSLLAIDRSGPEAQFYLDGLAFRLGLPKPLVAQLHRAVEAEEQQDNAAA